MCPYISIIFASQSCKKKEKIHTNDKKENLNIKKQSYILKFFKRIGSNLGKVVQDRGRVTDT